MQHFIEKLNSEHTHHTFQKERAENNTFNYIKTKPDNECYKTFSVIQNSTQEADDHPPLVVCKLIQDRGGDKK